MMQSSVRDNGHTEWDRCVLKSMEGGYYVITRQSYTVLCNFGIIVLITAKHELCAILPIACASIS